MARRRSTRPPLTIDQVLAWADEHFDRTGEWPQVYSGLVHAALGERWRNIDNALRYGLRGLPGGLSLPPLTEAQVEEWARLRHEINRAWPTEDSGQVPGTAGETWAGVNAALREGHRGLPGGSSLARLLADRLSVRTQVAVPPLPVETILAWADAFHDRHSRWPTLKDGPVGGVPGESWNAIQAALHHGARGLPRGGSLARLLQDHCGHRNKSRLPPLTVERVREWMLAHNGRTGRWPTAESGPVAESPGETWSAVAQALSQGLRGLPGGSSLARVRDR